MKIGHELELNSGNFCGWKILAYPPLMLDPILLLVRAQNRTFSSLQHIVRNFHLRAQNLVPVIV